MTNSRIDTTNIDLLIATDWLYDQEFVQLVKGKAEALDLSVLLVTQENLPETITDLQNNRLRVKVLFDRASDTSDEFYPIQRLGANQMHIIAPLERMRWASDKATMHLEFIANGLQTPYTIIIDSFNNVKNIHLSTDDLAHLGRPFIIKPANTTGGGMGVVDGAETLHDVLVSRRRFKSDKYLLQEKVKPLIVGDKRYWFRCFYSFGLAQCVWWDDITHEYSKLDAEEVTAYHLNALFSITHTIREICGLNFFSTEICVTPEHRFVVVDYVNEACDMRLQSSHVNGVPDAIVDAIADRICSHVAAMVKRRIS